MSALYNLASSFDLAGGRYRALRELRNDLEHHVVVVRNGTAPAAGGLKVILEADLRRDALHLGKLAKAALLYFGGSVWRAEFQRAKRGEQRGRRIVPGHSPVEKQ